MNAISLALSSSCLSHNKQFDYCHHQSLSCSDSEESSSSMSSSSLSSIQLFSSPLSRTSTSTSESEASAKKTTTIATNMLNNSSKNNSPTSSLISKSSSTSSSSSASSTFSRNSRKRRPSDEFEQLNHQQHGYLQSSYCSTSSNCSNTNTNYSGSSSSKRMAISRLAITTTTTSSSPKTSSSIQTTDLSRLQATNSPAIRLITNDNFAKKTINNDNQQQQKQKQRADPVYLEDEQVFRNLIDKERYMSFNSRQGKDSMKRQPILRGSKRHALLSWMLHICEQQACQDEIFALSTMILDKFLRIQYDHLEGIEQTKAIANVLNEQNFPIDELKSKDFEEDAQLLCNEQDEQQLQLNSELRERQLCLFAAASLLLATKFRQTPQLPIDILCQFSGTELPIELSRPEIIDGELLMLTMLKWDLASLVTPNDYLVLLQQKCPLSKILANLPANGSPRIATATADSNAIIVANENNIFVVNSEKNGHASQIVCNLKQNKKDLINQLDNDHQLNSNLQTHLHLHSTNPDSNEYHHHYPIHHYYPIHHPSIHHNQHHYHHHHQNHHEDLEEKNFGLENHNANECMFMETNANDFNNNNIANDDDNNNNLFDIDNIAKLETKVAVNEQETTTTNGAYRQSCCFWARCDESKVRRHTQTLLELCLMGK